MAQDSRVVDALHFAPGLSVGDGLQETLAGALHAIHRHTPQGAWSESPDAIHRFRVGVRRLRSILTAFGDALPERERRALSDRLHAIAQRYSRIREWDVFIADAVAPLRAAMPDAPALAELQELATESRRRSLPEDEGIKEAIAAVDTAIGESTWLRKPQPSLERQWQKPLRDYATELLDGRHRRLRKRIKNVDLSDQIALHQLRIRVKKLRYPAELLKSMFDESLATDYLDRLVRVQDVLGRLNDASVARDLIAELRLPQEAQLTIAGWIAHAIEISRDRFPAAGRDFRRAEPFWLGDPDLENSASREIGRIGNSEL